MTKISSSGRGWPIFTRSTQWTPPGATRDVLRVEAGQRLLVLDRRNSSLPLARVHVGGEHVEGALDRGGVGTGREGGGTLGFRAAGVKLPER